MSRLHAGETVVKAIRALGCDAEEILPIHDLQMDLGIDSTELIELKELVVAKMGLEARALSIREVRTVGEMISELERATCCVKYV